MDQTPSQIRNDELDIWRSKVIDSLRDLADILKSTPRELFPTPDINVSVYSVETPTDDDQYHCTPVTPAIVRAAMAAAPGSWHKFSANDHISYYKDIGDPLSFRFHVSRSTTCTKVQVGTKEVPAVEAHDEPVYEWRCDTPEVEV